MRTAAPSSPTAPAEVMWPPANNGCDGRPQRCCIPQGCDALLQVQHPACSTSHATTSRNANSLSPPAAQHLCLGHTYTASPNCPAMLPCEVDAPGSSWNTATVSLRRSMVRAAEGGTDPVSQGRVTTLTEAAQAVPCHTLRLTPPPTATSSSGDKLAGVVLAGACP